MIEKKISSAIPIYGIGIVFLLISFIFPPYNLKGLLISCIGSVVAYIILTKVFPGDVVYEKIPPKPIDTGNKEMDLLLIEGRNNINKIENLLTVLEGAGIKAKIEKLTEVSTKIINYAQKNNVSINEVKSFADYYLPTTLKLVEEYSAIKSEGADGDNIDESIKKIENVMDSLLTAFENKLNDLYNNKKMDIVVEVNVLEKILKSEGLLDGMTDIRKEGNSDEKQ